MSPLESRYAPRFRVSFRGDEPNILESRLISRSGSWSTQGICREGERRVGRGGSLPRWRARVRFPGPQGRTRPTLARVPEVPEGKGVASSGVDHGGEANRLRRAVRRYKERAAGHDRRAQALGVAIHGEVPGRGSTTVFGEVPSPAFKRPPLYGRPRPTATTPSCRHLRRPSVPSCTPPPGRQGKLLRPSVPRAYRSG